MSVVHLNTFSSYTLLSSTIMPEKLAEKAKEYGYEAVALTDRNAMYGVVPFYKACLQHSLRPIIGLTADVLPEGEET
ncbi:PHP domain-containing protein, partial [Caldibacillus debilis]